DFCQNGRKPSQFCAAFRTICQMRLQFFISQFVVVFQDHFVFSQVVHRDATSGSRLMRSFFTARNIVFLAAFSFTFKVLLISSIERPSIWRNVKAMRSVGVSIFIANAIFSFASRLSSWRSGPASVLATC